MKALSLFAVALILPNLSVAGPTQEPSFLAPGDLEVKSGVGIKDATVLFPTMRFPLESAPAFLNSQVYRKGGSKGPAGGQCDKQNYSYPWRDNFCERRGHSVAYCPAGTGHQGQDIRPATCNKSLHWAVAVEDGVIAQVGTFSVTLQSAGGTLYRYLHLDMKNLKVKELDTVKRGVQIGQVSNDFAGTGTTIHLHFDIKDTVLIKGIPTKTYVPPYTSLIESYKRLLAGAP
jgi:murein DD-endopeptidase MepM/ murein hydrolase activator NlpD